MLLTGLTLGIYHPWAKAKSLKFLYQSISFNDDPLTFHGTGKEMLKGFLMSVVIILGLYSILFISALLEVPSFGFVLFEIVLLCIIPLAIHGTFKYRMSRTSWRGIRFGYRGDRKELCVNFLKWIGLTVVTLGIYSAWMSINLRKYILKNIKMGNLEFDYEAEGKDFFWLVIKGQILTMITLGIYSFWFQKQLNDFYFDHLSIKNGDQKITFKHNADVGKYFELIVVNALLLLISFGLAAPLVVVRNMEFTFNHLDVEGDINLDELNQTEEKYTNATGEEVGDNLELDFML